MSDDLADRLRKYKIETNLGFPVHPTICDEAAVEIDRLTRSVIGNYEHYFEGGLYDVTGEARTDVYLEECGKEGEPKTLELRFVTGSGTYSIVDLPPGTVKRLGNWLASVAQNVIVANRHIGDDDE